MHRARPSTRFLPEHPRHHHGGEGNGADAIHPGYGFLSENSTFAKMCRENDIAFIGPTPEVIDRMGNKSQARRTMMDAGVPVVPGTKKGIHDVGEALEQARKIGWPIMIKASSGGGGKGMRVSESEEDFADMFNIAQRESVNAFADNTMYLERAVQNPRHVEVQIIADNHGNVVALGERDCSVQRNHQKMIEESPSPALDEELRARMMDDAVKAARAVGYTSAGTIEFLLDDDRNYYFMEMNTRIQVEHCVTEMVTHTDLVGEMIRVAAGEVLSFSQDDIQLHGHAIECRINAETPEFLPSCGEVTMLHVPGGRRCASTPRSTWAPWCRPTTTPCSASSSSALPRARRPSARCAPPSASWSSRALPRTASCTWTSSPTPSSCPATTTPT